MVENDRYCVDIVTQVAAVRAALKKVEETVLRDHVANCVVNAIENGDEGERAKKISELIDVFGRLGR